MKFAGKTGYVGVSTAIAGINSWSLDYTTDMLETTDFSASGTAAYLPGVTRWSGTFSGFKDGAPQNLSTATVNLWLVESTSEGMASVDKVWKGDAFISGIHPTTNFDGIVQYSYDFQGTATITIPSS